MAGGLAMEHNVVSVNIVYQGHMAVVTLYKSAGHLKWEAERKTHELALAEVDLLAATHAHRHPLRTPLARVNLGLAANKLRIRQDDLGSIFEIRITDAKHIGTTTVQRAMLMGPVL